MYGDRVNESEWRKEEHRKTERRMWKAYETEQSQRSLSRGIDGSGLEFVVSVRALCPNPFSLAFFISPKHISLTREKSFLLQLEIQVKMKTAPTRSRKSWVAHCSPAQVFGTEQNGEGLVRTTERRTPGQKISVVFFIVCPL